MGVPSGPKSRPGRPNDHARIGRPGRPGGTADDVRPERHARGSHGLRADGAAIPGDTDRPADVRPAGRPADHPGGRAGPARGVDPDARCATSSGHWQTPRPAAPCRPLQWSCDGSHGRGGPIVRPATLPDDRRPQGPRTTLLVRAGGREFDPTTQGRSGLDRQLLRGGVAISRILGCRAWPSCPRDEPRAVRLRALGSPTLGTSSDARQESNVKEITTPGRAREGREVILNSSRVRQSSVLGGRARARTRREALATRRGPGPQPCLATGRRGRSGPAMVKTAREKIVAWRRSSARRCSATASARHIQGIGDKTSLIQNVMNTDL